MTGIAERRNEGTGPIDGGFIILSRTIEAEGGTFKYCRSNDERWMFIKSLLRANFQDVVVNGIELKRGQFLTSIEKFAKETKTTPKQVRRFWKFFEKLEFQASKRTNKYTIITILNYGRYQNMANYYRGKGHAKGQTKDKQRATDKEYKEEERINKTDVDEVFAYFLLKTQKTYSLTNDRRSIIEGRLKEGRTVEEMKRAIDNFARDDWEGREKYIDIIYCLGKQRGKPDNLDKWLNCKPAQEAPGKGWAE